LVTVSKFQSQTSPVNGKPVQLTGQKSIAHGKIRIPAGNMMARLPVKPIAPQEKTPGLQLASYYDNNFHLESRQSRRSKNNHANLC
jgi:hypothetical protein